MKEGAGKPDWSEGCWRQMLVDQRKFMWHEDTLDRIAAWLDLRPGMTAIDVGCGLGYLGYTYWRYFGQGGRYFGVDISPKLLRDAATTADEWAMGGEATFINAAAYSLPFRDDFADLVMCQVVMMHLEEPKRALAEMVRVAKPGGIIMCKAADNLSGMLCQNYLSLPNLTIDEKLLVMKAHLVCNRGRIELGRGDNNIAPKIPIMMKELGLDDVAIRMNDKVAFLYPPYESPRQQSLFKAAKKRYLDQYEFWAERGREEFIAGGGDPEEYERILKVHDRIRPVLKQQIDKGEYSFCGGYPFYVIKARKPG